MSTTEKVFNGHLDSPHPFPHKRTTAERVKHLELAGGWQCLMVNEGAIANSKEQ
jgi:hypothetical protein